MATPIFKTNLSQVPNSTPLLLVAEAHNYPGARLYVARSIQHLAKAQYKSFFYEKPANAEERYIHDRKELTSWCKTYSKDTVANLLMQPNQSSRYHVATNALLTWEAQSHGITTVYCDDVDFHKNNKNIDLNQSLVRDAIAEDFSIQSPRLQQTYSVPQSLVIKDFRYALYGAKTFANYAGISDRPADYLEDLSQVGKALRQSVIHASAKEDVLYEMHERNNLFADKMADYKATKAYGLFGYGHVAPINYSTTPTVSTILQDKYGMPSTRVAITDSAHVLNLVNDFRQSCLDTTVIVPEEVIPYAPAFFGVMPCDLFYALNSKTMLQEGIQDVKDQKSLGLDYAVLLPAFSENEHKLAVAKKIVSKCVP